MRKTTATLFTGALLAASTLTIAPPATAGADKIGICHATGNGKYVPLEVSKDGTANGHAGDTHQDARDIIPAYSWVQDKVRHYFEGQNQDKWHLLENGCNTDPVAGAVKPAPPVYTPPTCLDPDAPWGTVTIPEDLGEGIGSTTPAVLNTEARTWTVTYTLLPDSEDMTHDWPAGQDGVYTFPAAHISADPLWVVDSRTGEGQCELSDTGAEDWMVPAGAAGVGLLAAGVLLRRRFA